MSVYGVCGRFGERKRRLLVGWLRERQSSSVIKYATVLAMEGPIFFHPNSPCHKAGKLQPTAFHPYFVFADHFCEMLFTK